MSFHPSKSLRLAAAALVVFALVSLALVLPRAADAETLLAAKKCAGSTQIWKVNGRKVCLKTARVKAGHAKAEIPARLARWFDAATIPAPGSRLTVPKKLRAAAPKAASTAAKLIAQARRSKKSRISPKPGFAFTAAAGPRGAVLETMSQDGPQTTLPSGVTLSSHVVGRSYEDGSQQYDVNVDASYQGYTIRYSPDMNAKFSVIPDVDCPTSDGLLKIDYTSAMGGTMMVLKGNNVLGAITEKFTDELHARGHVGRDAKLHDVDVQVTAKVEHYERGVQMVWEATGDFDVSREGEPVAAGPFKADMKIRAASLTRAQERDAEVELAAQIANSSSEVNSLASHAEVARWQMMQDEYKWYSLPGRCADIRYNPDSIATLQAGQKAAVEGRVLGKDGKEAAGDLSIVSVERGSFSATKTQADPGSPARFNATGATPDSDKNTVASDVIATSTAGRAQAGWYAKGDVLPEKLSGTISASSSTPGTKDYFHSWVVYTLDKVYVSDGGYVSAWYKLTTADQDEVQQEIGVGCRWVGKGSGGNIEDGDIELNKAPGGTWHHAVMYDVEIPNATFEPTDCGSSPPPAFTGNLVGFVNMAMLGGGFEPVDDNFHMGGLRVYEDPASQRKTVASWDFEPGDPQ